MYYNCYICGRCISHSSLLCDKCRKSIDHEWGQTVSKKSKTEEYQSVDDPDIRANGDTPKPVESKEARFLRLANKRVPAAIKRLMHVANLANRQQYTYTDEQVKRITDSLEGYVQVVKQRFAGQKDAADRWTL